MAHGAGALLYVDGTQSVGALRFDLREIQPDMLAVDPYKWLLSPNGASFFYITPELRRTLQPAVIGWRSDRGWRSVDDLHHGAPQWPEGAERYEGGMLNFPSLYGLADAVRMQLEIGPEVIEHRVLELSAAVASILRRNGADIVHERGNIVAAHWPDRRRFRACPPASREAHHRGGAAWQFAGVASFLQRRIGSRTARGSFVAVSGISLPLLYSRGSVLDFDRYQTSYRVVRRIQDRHRYLIRTHCHILHIQPHRDRVPPGCQPVPSLAASEGRNPASLRPSCHREALAERPDQSLLCVCNRQRGLIKLGVNVAVLRLTEMIRPDGRNLNPIHNQRHTRFSSNSASSPPTISRAG